MADTGTQAPPAKGKKKKSVPTWYYIAGAGALLVAYYAYSKSQASKAAAAASASTPAGAAGSSAGTAAGSYGNAGDLAALAPYLQAQAANGTSTTGSGAGTIPTGQTLAGGGYQPAGGQPGSTVAGANGVTYQWVPGNALPALEAANTPFFIQTTPGIFTPFSIGEQGVPGGTAIYQQVPSGSGTSS